MKKIILLMAFLLVAAPALQENIRAKEVDKVTNSTPFVNKHATTKSVEETNFAKQEFAKMKAEEAIKNAKRQNSEYKKAQKAARKELQNLKRQRNEERLKYEKEMQDKQSVIDTNISESENTADTQISENFRQVKNQETKEIKHNLQPQEPERMVPKKSDRSVETQKENIKKDTSDKVNVEKNDYDKEINKQKLNLENNTDSENSFDKNKQETELSDKNYLQDDITPEFAQKSDYLPVEKNKKEMNLYKKQIKEAGLKFNEEDFVKQAEFNKTEMVRIYLMAGMKPDVSLKSNTTPLIWASFNGNLAMVKNLAEAGANVNVVNADGFTPLHAAVESEKPEVVRYLLQRGAKINTATVQDGTTPLHTACYKGNKEIVQILIVAGANIEAKTVHGATPLVTAAFYGKKDIVECLKSNGAKIDVDSKEGEVLAKSAIKANRTESYDELVKAGADVNMTDENGKTMLQAAVEKNDIKTVEMLLKDGANVNVLCKYKESSNVTPLMTAVIDKNEAVVKSLLKANADLDVKENNLGLTALQIAIIQGNEDIAADLIFNGANINALSNNGFTAADFALARKDISMLKKLVASGALFGKNTGAELVKFGCSMRYDTEKGLYKIDANDAITAVLELEQTQNDGYVKYMEKSYTFRKEQGFALNQHLLKVYRLLYEIIE